MPGTLAYINVLFIASINAHRSYAQIKSCQSPLETNMLERKSISPHNAAAIMAYSCSRVSKLLWHVLYRSLSCKLIAAAASLLFSEKLTLAPSGGIIVYLIYGFDVNGHTP